jgi:hypothetical protein
MAASAIQGGMVEGVVGYGRRNFLVPAPRFDSFDDLNAWLEEQCLKRQDDVVRGHGETIGERLMRDLDALMPLPPAPYDACEKVSTRATSISMVRYRSPELSLGLFRAGRLRPPRRPGPGLCPRGDHRLRDRGHRSPPAFLREGGHDLRPDALSPAAGAEGRRPGPGGALKGWNLPSEFATLHRLLEARMGKKGKREYVQVLRLLETFDMGHLHSAVKQALNLGAIGYDAVKHLVLCAIEQRPPRLDLEFYPYLPKALVETTKPASYMSLMAGAAS